MASAPEPRSKIKSYLIGIGVFWTFGGVILLALEIKQLKSRIEVLDRKAQRTQPLNNVVNNTPGPQNMQAPQALQSGPSLPAVGQVNRTYPTPSLVTEKDLLRSVGVAQEAKMDNKKIDVEGRQTGKPIDPASIIGTESNKNTPLDKSANKDISNEAGSGKAVASDSSQDQSGPTKISSLYKEQDQLSDKTSAGNVMIEDLRLKRDGNHLEVKFVIRSIKPGVESEGRIVAQVMLQTPGNDRPMIGTSPSELDPEKITPESVRKYGQFFRFKYRLQKTMTFLMPPDFAEGRMSLMFYIYNGTPKMQTIRLNQILVPRLARFELQPKLEMQ